MLNAEESQAVRDAAAEEVARAAVAAETAQAARDAARAAAADEGLVLFSGSGVTGFKGVKIGQGKHNSMYEAQPWIKGCHRNLGLFSTAEEAALAVARALAAATKRTSRSCLSTERERNTDAMPPAVTVSSAAPVAKTPTPLHDMAIYASRQLRKSTISNTHASNTLAAANTMTLHMRTAPQAEEHIQPAIDKMARLRQRHAFAMAELKARQQRELKALERHMKARLEVNNAANKGESGDDDEADNDEADKTHDEAAAADADDVDDEGMADADNDGSELSLVEACSEEVAPLLQRPPKLKGVQGGSRAGPQSFRLARRDWWVWD